MNVSFNPQKQTPTLYWIVVQQIKLYNTCGITTSTTQLNDCATRYSILFSTLYLWPIIYIIYRINNRPRHHHHHHYHEWWTTNPSRVYFEPKVLRIAYELPLSSTPIECLSHSSLGSPAAIHGPSHSSHFAGGLRREKHRQLAQLLGLHKPRRRLLLRQKRHLSL